VERLQAGALLREVARLHWQMQRDSLACCGGTTATQYSILTELGRSGPLTLTELGRRLAVDKGWVSRAVEAMVQERLLLKEPGQEDRRTVKISLSEAGMARLRELNQVLNAQSERVMNRIPEQERAMVYRALERLYLALRDEAGSGAPPQAEEETS
jgi:DNA-binding MarR family transcriptional regulator